MLQGVPVQILVDSGASENFVDREIANCLGRPVKGNATSISMASSEVSVQTCGKVSGELNLLGRKYRDASFNIMQNLCADVIVGQEFLKRHASVTFVMYGTEETLLIATPMCSDAAHLSVAVAKRDTPRLFEFLSPNCKPGKPENGGIAPLPFRYGVNGCISALLANYCSNS